MGVLGAVYSEISALFLNELVSIVNI